MGKFKVKDRVEYASPSCSGVRMTMLNLHKLLPCACCPARMAVPGSLVCTICAATDAAMVVPDTIEEVVYR